MKRVKQVFDLTNCNTADSENPMKQNETTYKLVKLCVNISYLLDYHFIMMGEFFPQKLLVKNKQ